MCERCELKTQEQLTMALAALENVWGEQEDAVRRDLRTYLIDAIEEYEDRHVQIPECSWWDRVLFRYDQSGRIVQAIRTGFEVLGEKMWRAMVPQQREEDEE